MFIGHFAAGFAAKKLVPQVNLGGLIFAGQFLDLLWPILVLFGIEKVQVDPHATTVTPFNFISYPYSHSLLMSAVYGLLLGWIFWRLYNSKKIGWIIALTVLSHWILDVISHRADIPIAFGESKIGFGLWNSLILTASVELILFTASVVLVLQSTTFISNTRKFSFYSLVAFLYLVYTLSLFAPIPPQNTPPIQIATPGLASWLLVYWSYWVDKKPKI